MKLKHVLFCALFGMFSKTANAQAVNVQDSLALVDLYNSTNGSSWFNPGSWLSGPVSNWLGVGLTEDGKGVSKVNLNYNNLNGLIPPTLGNLSTLQYLDLSLNKLSGNIPAELGNLSMLQYLNLSLNKLSGNIPAKLGNLLMLQYLSLSLNKLSGNIPSELGNLLNLSSVWLNNNQLSGNIPSELGNLSNLFSLVLYSNQLSGIIPHELGNLSNLSLVWLNDNKLSGNIPAALGNLSKVSILDLSHNQLSGNVPSELVKLHHTNLKLSHNRFTFDGMELMVQTLSNFTYNWQAPIPLHLKNNTLSVSAGGTLSNNTYMWFKQGEKGNTTIKGDSVFQPTESGVYYVVVINKIAKQLKLASYPVSYSAPSSLNVIASNKQLQFSSNIFIVYPNPAKDILHIQTNSKATVTLTDQSGKTIFTKTVNGKEDININYLPSGLYYLKNDETGVSQKIIITK